MRVALVEGIEPPTRGFGDRCSTTELHQRNYSYSSFAIFKRTSA